MSESLTYAYLKCREMGEGKLKDECLRINIELFKLKPQIPKKYFENIELQCRDIGPGMHKDKRIIQKINILLSSK